MTVEMEPVDLRVCMSSINSSVLLRRSPNHSGGGVHDGGLPELYTSARCQHGRGEGTGYDSGMYVEARPRGRLFERPEEPRPFRITARDLGLLTNLARLRLASIDQLAALDGGSGQNVSRSLLVLWEHGYVDRLLGQVESR